MRSQTKYIVIFLAAIGLIVLAIVLIVHLLLSPSSKQTTSLPALPADLTAQAETGTTVQLTVDSPIVAPAQHHDIVINVGNEATTLTVTRGYNGEVVRSRSYPMNINAYRVFLRSLVLNGFTQGNPDPAQKDERGHCALGNRYIYQVIDPSGQTTQRFWSTSCGSGTFNGDGPTILQLFRGQVPDYSRLTNDIIF